MQSLQYVILVINGVYALFDFVTNMKYNYEEYISTDQILDLFNRDYRFEFHKSQGH